MVYQRALTARQIKRRSYVEAGSIEAFDVSITLWDVETFRKLKRRWKIKSNVKRRFDVSNIILKIEVWNLVP